MGLDLPESLSKFYKSSQNCKFFSWSVPWTNSYLSGAWRNNENFTKPICKAVAVHGVHIVAPYVTCLSITSHHAASWY